MRDIGNSGPTVPEGMHSMTPYHPPEELLHNYAELMVNTVLNKGEGLREGETVYVRLQEGSRPIYEPIQEAILRGGGHMLMDYRADGMKPSFYEHASDDQLNHFHSKFWKGTVDELDHILFVLAENNLTELSHVPAEKKSMVTRSMKPWMEWRREKK